MGGGNFSSAENLMPQTMSDIVVHVSFVRKLRHDVWWRVKATQSPSLCAPFVERIRMEMWKRSYVRK